MPDAVIVSTARSPIGRARKGSMTDVRPDDLAAAMVRAALDKIPQLNPADIDDLMLGCAQPSGEAGYNMARVVSVLADLKTTPGTTVNRYCASSLQTSRMAFHAVKAGEGDVFISAGVESVSHTRVDDSHDPRNPIFTDAMKRTDRRVQGGAETWTDPAEDGALPDVYIQMGRTAENVAQLTGTSRADQDEFAVRSQNRAEAGLSNGFWERDITPYTLTDGQEMTRDDGIRPGTTLEKVAGLTPVFAPDGTVTAGNACPLNDGAAALVIMSDAKAAELGLEPLARIVSTGGALARANMLIGDIDLVEINEAFAAQVIPSARELGVEFDRLNINGGAIAVGHPFGSTGARIATTLINSMQFHDKQFGLETMCVGGGQGMAMVLERLK